MKTVRSSRVVAWSVVLVVLALVGMLVWLLVSPPSFRTAGGRTIPCRPIIGEVGTGNQGGISLLGIDGVEQSNAWREYMDAREERLSSWQDVMDLEDVRAALVMGRACQDARANRQTSVNLTLAVLVMVVIPTSLYGVQRSNRSSSPIHPSGSTSSGA